MNREPEPKTTKIAIGRSKILDSLIDYPNRPMG
jgi:hypothetical protein